MASSTPAAANTPAAAPAQVEPISANPGAVNLVTGTGLLGRLIGLKEDSGVRIGGLWIGNADYLIRGGIHPRTWSFNSLFLLDLSLDSARLLGIPGGLLSVQMLQFNGQPANDEAGAVIGYDGLTEPKPLVRTELYQLWWRQALFDDKLILRVGKTVPTLDFNNVSVPVPAEDTSLSIPAVTSLIYTPIFKNPTLIGVMPGYYNSAYGITGDFNATRNLYFKYAFYDGALGTGVQTGLREYPSFNGHHFMMGETGYTYMLDGQTLPGMLAMGGWAQTGKLSRVAGPKKQGAEGFYAFGSQRLWRRHVGVDNSGVSGFFQFGINDSSTMIADRYFGFGFTGFGLIPGRPADSIGTGLGWSWLNRRYGFRSNEAMLQAYYQMHLIGTPSFSQLSATFLIPAPVRARRARLR